MKLVAEGYVRNLGEGPEKTTEHLLQNLQPQPTGRFAAKTTQFGLLGPDKGSTYREFSSVAESVV